MSPIASAATVQGLYSVTVPRDPAATDQRAAAERAAMAGLLIRVTGAQTAALDPAAEPLLAAPREYILSSGELPGGSHRVEFRRAPIEAALMALGMRVWGPERPLTLIWVAVDDGVGGRQIVGANETSELGGAATPAVTAMLKSVREELALSCTLTFLYKFEYQARYLDVGSEHELCWVFAGRAEGVPAPDEAEIAEWRWVAPAALGAEIAAGPGRFTPWLRLEWAEIVARHLPQALSGSAAAAVAR